MKSITEIHKAMSDPTRIMILRLLLERELCVCELMRSLEFPQYKISKHVAVLKQAGLVHDWREGTWIHYEIAPGLDEEWKNVLEGLKLVWDRNHHVQAALWRLQQKVQREPGDAVTACECASG